jgi:hypothetical protein
MGLVFRYGDLNNYYRFSLDRNRKYRRLVSVVTEFTPFSRRMTSSMNRNSTI